MKNKLIIIYFVYGISLNFSCSNNNHNAHDSFNPSDTSYKVYKIDSINNFYLIYVSKKGAHFKIISAKEFHEKCKRIQKDNYYDFQLYSMLSSEWIMSGLANCVIVDSITTICLEDSILDLTYATDIKGLCFEKKE